MDNKTIIANGDRRARKMRYVEDAFDWDSLDGKKVLDVGAAYGIWSIRAVKAGADVIATGAPDAGWEKKFKVYCEHHDLSIPFLNWDIQQYRNRKSDVVLFFAVLHHVQNPGKALDNVFRVAQERIWIEAAIDTPNAQAGYYYPTVEELRKEIEDRGGEIRNLKEARRGKYPRVTLEVLV